MTCQHKSNEDCMFCVECGQCREDLDDNDMCPDCLKFTNHYKCPRCGHEWTDQWSCTCDDDCPECGCRHISPHHSEDVP
jgi:hypothetical protein